MLFNSNFSTPIVYSFKKGYESIQLESGILLKPNFTEHPLFSFIFRIHLQNIETIKYDKAILKSCEEEIKDARPALKTLDQKKNCDQILAEYLQNISIRSQPEYYEKVIALTLIYREYYNKNGIINYEKKYSEDNLLKKNICENENTEFMPRACNDLLNDDFPSGFPIEIASPIILNICERLYSNSYTVIQIKTAPNEIVEENFQFP